LCILSFFHYLLPFPVNKEYIKPVRVCDFTIPGFLEPSTCRRCCGSKSLNPALRGDGGRRRGREASAAVQRCVVPGACIQLIRYAKTLGWLPWPPDSNGGGSSNSSPSDHPALIASLSLCLSICVSYSPTVVFSSPNPHTRRQSTSSETRQQ